MEESVYSFENVTLRHRRYLVLVVRWSEFKEDVSKRLFENIEEFGEYMEAEGALIVPYKNKMREAFGEVVKKDWPQPVKMRMNEKQYPFLVIIDQDFKTFDPKAKDHRSAIIWFADFEEDPDDVWKVLNTIANKIQSGEDLFEYLEAVESKARRAKIAKHGETIAKYVDIDIPIIPGFVSVKAGAIWADVMKQFQ